ncbi:DNA-3-methyladenine glycosylase I [Lactobacillus sp. YT155]|uniref:DNA-3-methyladenine glycosylase I n=1 Tax=Lactobacillus sp. YT155 TaxID=3060955 RepID=UPI00265EFD2A|nr:DNA-3-methyladenine glycosylase I [Lactobacillus sp. YT155]MDO1605750.1 DNA-3-methyladenine glycosylase I [Lactobacillus sp. YT155]
MTRCAWANSSPNMMEYHDHEWGIVNHDDQYLFELLTLELFQSGLSWQTILNKRDEFKKAFDNFEIEKVKEYDEKKFVELMNNSGIIRNRLKINATINNAKIISDLHQNKQTFDDFIWENTDHQIIVNHYDSDSQMPAFDELSTKVSKKMKQAGFRFVGPTTIYSFLQASGVINDHIDSCDFK